MGVMFAPSNLSFGCVCLRDSFDMGFKISPYYSDMGITELNIRYDVRSVDSYL